MTADAGAALAAVTGVLVLAGWWEGGRRRAARRRVLALGAGDPSAPGAGGGRPAPLDPVATLPDVLDLLAVAAEAGLPVPLALAVVSDRAPPPWGAALDACLATASGGALLHEALPVLAEHAGDASLPLVGVLRSALVDGERLAPGLAGLAADARDLRRRRAEEAAARLPVRLLLPLVCCSLPAVAVLTIVPILAGALRGLRLSP